MLDFILNQPVGLEESMTCEFKEVKSQPVHIVGKTVDEYVVAFLNAEGGSIYWGIRNVDRVVTGLLATAKIRDELKQVIGQKVSAIAPPVPAATVDVPFHDVADAAGGLVPDMYVLEVRVAKPEMPGLFLTGAGEAYRKTLGGTKKLSGAELFMALAGPLQAKLPKPKPPSVLAQFPALYRRFQAVEPLIRGKRVLWVDDRPSNNFYERLALSQMGLMVDIATTSEEGLSAAAHLHPAVIISDIERNGHQEAGLRFLRSARAEGIRSPVIFYIGEVIEAIGVPAGAFAITDRADEVLHFVLDVLERAVA